MNSIGAPELLIILAIVVLVFGVGRIGKIAGEIGTGINAFKKGLQGDEEEKKPETVQKASTTEETPVDPKQ